MNKLKALKTSELDDAQQMERVFSNSLVELSKRGELLIKLDDLLPFQQYFQLSLETLAKSLDRSVSALSKEKLFINQLAYINKNLLNQDMHYLLQECKSRFGDCESFMISKILQENDSDMQAIMKQHEIELNDRKKSSSDNAEKELATIDHHYIDNILEGVLDQYNPNSKKYYPENIETAYGDKSFSRQGTGSGPSSGSGNQRERDSLFDQSILGSQKNIGSGTNIGNKNRKTFLKANDFESQRKTLLNQEDTYKKSKNSYALNLFQNSLNKEKKNSRIDNIKVKGFGTQRIAASKMDNREKSDSVSETPKEPVIYNLNTTKLGAKFDKDYVEKYNSMQPQIDYQKNLGSALDDNRYKDSPNFVRNNYENPLLRYINLSSPENQDTSDDLANPISMYASFLDRTSTGSPKKINTEIDKGQLFFQMNEKLNENLLNFLMNTPGNLAEIKPEEIRFEKFEDKVEEKEIKKKKGKKNDNSLKNEDETSKSVLHTKNLTIDEKELPTIEDSKNKKKENFFSRHKNQKKGEKKQQKVKKIDEKDFIKIDENTEIKGKLEYVDIDEHSAEDIKDYELFDLNYRSEEETLKNGNQNNNWINEYNLDNTFINFFSKLEREEFMNLVKIFSTNNPKQWWKQLRNSFSSNAIYNRVTKILNDTRIPEIKRRDFDFRRKHKVIVSNLFGQNSYV